MNCNQRLQFPFIMGVLCTVLLYGVFTFSRSAPSPSKSSASIVKYVETSRDTCQCRAEDRLRRDSHIKERMTRISSTDPEPDDADLVQFIRDEFIDLPRPFVTKFSMPLFQTAQANAVDKILKKKTGGFFIECGALDGERSSNTNWLEQKRGWNGLLIEMDPSYYLQIRGKNRKCLSINACLSPEAKPVIMPFREHAMGEGRLMKNAISSSKASYDTYCFPFLSIMRAINVTHVDYFSLDVEGLELDILRTIPFDLIDISVFTVEFVHGPDKGKGYIDFMEKNGYTLHSTIRAFNKDIYYGANDFVFVKNH